MKTNVARPHIRTHEGAVAKHINAEQQLRRTVMTCMLWEDGFYEDGKTVADRIKELVAVVPAEVCAEMAVTAREAMKLRHAPLLIVRELARRKGNPPGLVRKTLGRVIQRADELAEFLAIYWKDGRCPIAKQVQRGLADAFQKFSAYDLAKYNRDGAIKLRDVAFLAHAKPTDLTEEGCCSASAITGPKYKRGDVLRHSGTAISQLIAGTLPIPDTWETALSAAGKEGDKRAIWSRLLSEKKLGALALLRNLRNMREAKVEERKIRAALAAIKPERVLPFRFIAAARHAPEMEPELETAMFKCLEGRAKLPGETILMVDVSSSMDGEISSKSDLKRVDAACGLAMLLREVCETVKIFTFSNALVPVPARRGFALRDAVVGSQPHGGTALGAAVRGIMASQKSDRLIVISDEQSADPVPDADRKAYMINVASNKNGVGYGSWLHIDGWSEACLDFIAELERGDSQS